MSQKLETTPDPLTPASAEEVAAILRTASERRQSVVIRGAGTKIDWGRPATPIDIVLDMRGLHRVLAHPHGDLTATIEAGATLEDVNRTLGAHGQWLPLDPPFAERATIGGLLATNDSGPLRHRHGTPRDLVIGVQLATTDGVLAKAGGQVVKNVAGYDLSKLITGSFGSLAAIVSATFKLAPLPVASKTIRAAAADAESLQNMVRSVMASQLEPVAFEITSRQSRENAQNTLSGHVSATSANSALRQAQGIPSLSRDALTVLLRFASLPQVVDAQIEQARRLLGAGAADVLDGPSEHAAWRDHAEHLWNAPGAILRASWMPANIAGALADLQRIAGSSAEMLGRAAIGAGLVRLDAEAPVQARIVEALRQSSSFANVVVLRGSPALKALVDVWGSPGDRAPLFASLKQAFDPHGILNAGRGPL